MSDLRHWIFSVEPKDLRLEHLWKYGNYVIDEMIVSSCNSAHENSVSLLLLHHSFLLIFVHTSLNFPSFLYQSITIDLVYIVVHNVYIYTILRTKTDNRRKSVWPGTIMIFIRFSKGMVFEKSALLIFPLSECMSYNKISPTDLLYGKAFNYTCMWLEIYGDFFHSRQKIIITS